MRTTLFLGGVLWGLAGLGGQSSVVFAAPPSTVLLSSSPEAIQFRVEFEAPELREEEASGHRYTYPSWSGLVLEGDPGGPGLPVLRVRVALPPRGEPELTVIDEPRSQLSGARFPPMGEWEPQEPRKGQRDDPRPAARVAEGPAYGTYRPLPFAEIEGVGQERGLRVATVILRPAVWDPQTESAAWVASLEVTIGIRGASPRGPTRAPRPDRAGMASWKDALLNPQDALVFREALAPDTCAAGIPTVWFDDADVWVKIEVDSSEIYGVNRNALELAGAFLTGVDPRTFRLYAGPLVPDVAWAALGWDTLSCSQSQQIVPAKPHVYERPGFCGGFPDTGAMGEIPLWVRGEEDGIFDPGDLLVFYAMGPDNFRDRLGLPPGGEAYFANPYTRHTVYWLTWESGLPGTPLRMEVVDAAPLPGAIELQDSAARLHTERNTFEDPSLYTPGLLWERWFWDFLTSDQGAKRFTIPLPHVVSASTLDAVVRLWGARVPTKENSEAALHHVEVTVNGVPGPMAVWGGTTALAAISPQDMTLTDIPSRSLSEFLFRVPQVPSMDRFRYDEVHLAWIDVTYRRELHLDGRAGELEIDPLPAGGTLRLSAPPAGQLVLLDVSDPRHPRRLTGAVAAGGELQVGWTRPSSGMIAAAQEANLLAPASLFMDGAPRSTPGGATWLRDPSEPVDYLIIVPEGWIPEADLLADWRTHHLYPFTEDTTGGFPRDALVRVVGVGDIMDEFAWGMWDPAAIRYFLEYAFRFYGQAGDDPPAYCLFLGDATNDPRDYGGSGVRDYVPSWEDNRDPIGNIVFGNVQYVSDDALARFDGVGTNGCADTITDLYLGRIPASSRAEARDLIRDKVIRSEEAPPPGTWRTKAILVADDICQGGSRDLLGTAHTRQTEVVADSIPDVFNLDKVYLIEYGEDCSILTKPAAKQDLIHSWTEGAWLVNYVGHGGDVVWADEHVLDLSDTPLLLNGGKLPVVGSFSCSVGKFSNPNRDGLGEAHLRSRSGGSLVTVAATHLTSSASNAGANFEFMQRLFSLGPDRPKPAGVALMETKRNARYFGSESDKYVCLGDPASPPMVPRETLSVTGPARLERGTVASVRAEIPGGLGRSGTVSFDVRDSYLVKSIAGIPYKLAGAPLYRGEEMAEADTALGVFTVPVSLRGGPEGRISLYAWGTDWDAAGVIAPLEVGGTSVAGTDTVGPDILFTVTDPDLESGENVTVHIEDVSGINITRLFEFRSILLKILDRTGLEQLRQDLTDEFTYDLGSHTRGEIVFRVPDLEPGAYTFSVSATDNFNNRNQEALAAEVGSAEGAAEFEGLQAAYPNPFDPGVEPTQLMFSLTRSAEVSLRIYSVSGRLVHEADLSAAAGPNVVTWNGRDRSGDLVSNGVYLAQMTAKRPGSEESRKIMERLVVLR